MDIDVSSGGCPAGRSGSPGGWPPIRRYHAACVQKSLPPFSPRCRRVAPMWIFGGAAPVRGDRMTDVLNSPMSDVWSYSLNDGTWRSHPPMQLANAPGLYYHSAVWSGDTTQRFIIFGGTSDGRTPLKGIYEYNPYTGETVDISVKLTYVTQPQARYGHTAAFIPASKQMYIFGGKGAYSYEIYNDLWTYYPLKYEWKLVPSNPNDPTPKIRYSHAGCTSADKLYVWGGIQKWGRRLNDLWEWNPQTQLWNNIKIAYYDSSVPSSAGPEPMFGAAGAVRGNFYLFGGSTGTVHRDSNTMFRISIDGDPKENYSWTNLMVVPDDFSASTLVEMESYGGGYETKLLMFGGDVSRLEWNWFPFWNFEDGESFVDYELKSRWVRGPSSFMYSFSTKDGTWTYHGGEPSMSWWYQGPPPKPPVVKPSELAAAAEGAGGSAASSAVAATTNLHQALASTTTTTATTKKLTLGQMLRKVAESSKMIKTSPAVAVNPQTKSVKTGHISKYVKGIIPT